MAASTAALCCASRRSSLAPATAPNPAPAAAPMAAPSSGRQTAAPATVPTTAPRMPPVAAPAPVLLVVVQPHVPRINTPTNIVRFIVSTPTPARAAIPADDGAGNEA